MANITVTVTTDEPSAPVRTFFSTIGDLPAICCDGRELHAYLGNGELFATWIKARIEKYGFEEGKDFECFSQKSEKPTGELALEKTKAKHGGHNRTDYRLSLNMAKELSMVENNAQGKLARLYFLECERRALAAQGKSLHEYTVQAGQTLSEEQAHTLRVMMDDAIKGLPKQKQGAFMTAGWSKLKAHFGVSYRQIPAAQFHDAVSLISRHIVTAVALPAPEPTPAPELASPQQVLAIRRAVEMASRGMRHSSAWTQGIHAYLRKALDNPAPNPWTVDQLPALAREMTRVMAATEQVGDLLNKIEREAVRRIFRKGEVADSVITEIDQSTSAAMAGLNTDRLALPTWLQRDVAAITAA